MIEYLVETGSTNADLLARIARGDAVPEGLWLVTDRQLSGRGRQGRDWFGGGGNFMGSCLVHIAVSDPPAPTLALVAALAVHEAVSPLVPPPHRALLKWPNDLLIGGAKLCGILLERQGDCVVVGIGVNLAASPLLDRETVSLAAFGPAPDRDSFAVSLAGHFAQELQRWREFGLEVVVRRWLAAAHPLGTPLSVADPAGGRIEGTFAGLNADGALQLQLPDGTARIIHAGDVHLADEN